MVHWLVQLIPALTDFKGPSIFTCYMWISVIANIENKEKLFKGPKNSFRYRQISVTSGSVIAGFKCIDKKCWSASQTVSQLVLPSVDWPYCLYGQFCQVNTSWPRLQSFAHAIKHISITNSLQNLFA